MCSDRSTNPSRRYCLITPCRNEQDHLPQTIRTVADQTILPACWVIVDDGSSDATPQILEKARQDYPFIRVVRREDRGKRSVGPGVIEAFYAGLETIDLQDFDYLCKLDADLELPPRYFEHVMEEFEADPLLGNFSGKAYLRLEDGRLVLERTGDENANGQAKFYRVECFQQIGGFVRQVSWDGIDGHMCRMKGWIAASADRPELRFIHQRLMGSSEKGIWTGRTRWGAGKYFMGSAWYYVVAVGFYRMFERPFLIGGIGIIWGYLKAALTRQPRFDNLAVRRWLRRYELQSLLKGKQCATRALNAQIRQKRLKASHGQAEVIG